MCFHPVVDLRPFIVKIPMDDGLVKGNVVQFGT